MQEFYNSIKKEARKTIEKMPDESVKDVNEDGVYNSITVNLPSPPSLVLVNTTIDITIEETQNHGEYNQLLITKSLYQEIGHYSKKS